MSDGLCPRPGGQIRVDLEMLAVNVSMHTSLCITTWDHRCLYLMTWCILHGCWACMLGSTAGAGSWNVMQLVSYPSCHAATERLGYITSCTHLFLLSFLLCFRAWGSIEEKKVTPFSEAKCLYVDTCDSA